jgi:hypothetical protein
MGIDEFRDDISSFIRNEYQEINEVLQFKGGLIRGSYS